MRGIDQNITKRNFWNFFTIRDMFFKLHRLPSKSENLFSFENYFGSRNNENSFQVKSDV